MKKILITVIASMLAVMGYAQSSLLATLSQNGEISTFYGTQAFVDAYNAAEDGAVITLSSGSFAATDINKGITIRGAGMGIDANSKTEPTILSGNFTIEIPEEVTSHLTIEGIYHNYVLYFKGTLRDLTLIRCRFKEIEMDERDGNNLQNATFINCRISEHMSCGAPGVTISYVNSIIVEPGSAGASSDESYSDYSNCIIIKSPMRSIYNSTFRNCIFSGTGWIANACSAYNCVWVDKVVGSPFTEVKNNTNTSDLYDAVFKTFTGTYTDDETFELTDEAKTKYLGLDGTQVGIYGGAIPYSATPSTPRIVKCDVAPKSSADGKLSIEIEVGDSE